MKHKFKTARRHEDAAFLHDQIVIFCTQCGMVSFDSTDTDEANDRRQAKAVFGCPCHKDVTNQGRDNILQTIGAFGKSEPLTEPTYPSDTDSL